MTFTFVTSWPILIKSTSEAKVPVSATSGVIVVFNDILDR